MSRVHEFSPEIYPRKLWIAVGTGQFKERFSGLSEWNDNTYAIVDNAYDDERKLGGIFIRFESVDIMTFENVTHESIHAALEIYNYINASVEIQNQEPFCYLAGWIAKCCEEVKKCEQEDK